MLIRVKIEDHYNKFIFVTYSLKMNEEILTLGNIEIEISLFQMLTHYKQYKYS